MGVIFQVGDDVADLLVPFVHEKGGAANSSDIEAAYEEASLGRISAPMLWNRVGLWHDLEDEYLSRFVLTDDLPELLEDAAPRFERIYCLSNDVPEWSVKLRRRFGLEPYFSGWYISGDLGMRKPDPAIYARILTDLGADPAEVLFVDDRPKNLEPAAKLGMHTVLYHPEDTPICCGHRSIRRLTDLLKD